MKPIFTTIDNVDLMIMPDSQASADGHIVLTYTYSIYKDRYKGSGEYIKKKERELHLTIKDDPDYYGFITFEQPGNVFQYTADGSEELSDIVIRVLIEIIIHYRNTPSLWIID